MDLEFKVISDKGYLISRKNHVLEMGFMPTTTFQDLHVHLPFDGGTVLEVPIAHKFCGLIPESHDVTYEYRQCLYGGHMVCDLARREGNVDGLKRHFWAAYGMGVGLPRRGESFNLPFLDQL